MSRIVLPDSYYFTRSFGRLRPIRRDQSCDGKINGPYFVCECKCGTVFTTRGYGLRIGSVRSCGCLRRESNRKRQWKGCGDLPGRFWGSIKDGAKSRGVSLEITIDDAWQLFLAQSGKCAFTGLDLVMSSRSSERTASLDRKDSSLGYVTGNVQWVHKAINLMKGRLSEQEFIEWCRLVSERLNEHPT